MKIKTHKPIDEINLIGKELKSLLVLAEKLVDDFFNGKIDGDAFESRLEDIISTVDHYPQITPVYSLRIKRQIYLKALKSVDELDDKTKNYLSGKINNLRGEKEVAYIS